MSKCRQHSNNLIETEIGRIPKDWGLSKLSNIAQIIVSNVDKKVEENEAPVLLCNYMDVYQNEYITSNLEFMRGSASEAEINKFSLRRGDVLITKDSETAEDIASAAFVTDEIRNLICGYHLAILRPDIERMDSNFFAKTLQHDRVHNQFVTKANGVTRYGLTLSVINNATIPVPPLIEQAEIARILTTWDRAIERVQRLIEAKQRQKKGLMQGLLTGRLRFPEFGEPVYGEGDIPSGWKETKLINVADIIVSNVDKLTNENESDVLLCNYMDVYSNEYITNKIEFMRATASQPEISKYRLVRGDVLLTKDSETSEDIASTAVLMEDIENLLCGYHLAILRPDKDMVNPVFLSKHLSFGKTHKHFITHANGVTRYGLSLSSIFNTPICLPCLEEQRKIADLIMKIDREITIYSQQLEMFARQKKGLMQKLLTGEIRVKVD
jgi:type I restriction enzyme S subunit